MTVLEQGRVFLAMCLGGVVMGAVYDMLYLLRCATKAGKILTGICDLLFGVLCAGAMTLIALRMRISPLRWYEFAGMMTGMLAYAATMGTLVRIIQKRFKEFVKKVEKRGENRKKQAGKRK